ncbi:hypothetical protein FKP32DRAFT_1672465 [Trametes sanguinea]|nr:hypothetical protein FKP32DRAFT_1672465 [Trametes sanguinea]
MAAVSTPFLSNSRPEYPVRAVYIPPQRTGMPPLSYRECVERTLCNMAEAHDTSMNYDQFVDRVVMHKRWVDDPISPNKTMYIHRILVKEARGHRLRLVLKDKVKFVSLTPKGIAYYLEWQEPLGRGPMSRSSPRTDIQQNLDAIQYLSEMNQDMIDRNTAVCDRLHALDPTYLARIPE